MLLTGAEATGAPCVHIVNALTDQPLADDVAMKLIDWGMVPSCAGLERPNEQAAAVAAADRLRTASVVVVLLTSKAMTDVSVQHDAGTAIAQARLNPSKVIIPVLLDPGAYPEATFADHAWLVPLSHRSDDIAAASSKRCIWLRTPVGPTTACRMRLRPSFTWSVAQVRAAIAGTRFRRRAVVVAVGVLALLNLTLVALAIATDGADLSRLLLAMLSPIMTFVGVVLGFRLGQRDLAYRRIRDRR